MEPFTTLTSKFVAIQANDIDTDQIIPARFLKTTDKDGLGISLFADWRYNSDGTPKDDFVLNQPAAQGAQILFAGFNFGCGSSREHAPWALAGFGFQAVVAGSFADIFRNNALKNGLLPVELSPQDHRLFSDYLAEVPQAVFSIDLESQTITLPDGQTASFPIDAFSKTCLLKGVDELGYLQSFASQILAYEGKS